MTRGAHAGLFINLSLTGSKKRDKLGIRWVVDSVNDRIQNLGGEKLTHSEAFRKICRASAHEHDGIRAVLNPVSRRQDHLIGIWNTAGRKHVEIATVDHSAKIVGGVHCVGEAVHHHERVTTKGKVRSSWVKELNKLRSVFRARGVGIHLVDQHLRANELGEGEQYCAQRKGRSHTAVYARK